MPSKGQEASVHEEKSEKRKEETIAKKFAFEGPQESKFHSGFDATRLKKH